MKNLLTILLLSIVISGCSIPQYTLGMTEAEFKARKNWTATTELSEASAERTVYKQRSGPELHGFTPYLYYYFIDGKLVRIDEGEQKPAVVVEHVQAPR